jgi:hypothetical protein
LRTWNLSTASFVRNAFPIWRGRVLNEIPAKQFSNCAALCLISFVKNTLHLKNIYPQQTNLKANKMARNRS